jgi:tetratricopeptide (TPR) repeat protein
MNFGSVPTAKSRFSVISLVLAFAYSLAAGQPSSDWKVFYNRGAEALESGEPRDAVRQFQKAHAIEPDNPKVLHGLIVSNFASGRTGAALDASRRLLGILRNNADEFALSMAVGRVLAQYNQPADAMEFFKLAQQHTPPLINGRSSAVFFDNLFAALLGQMQQDATAIARLQRAADSDPSDSAQYYQLGLMLIKTAKFPQAYEVLRPALEKFPRSFELRLGYALACYFMGKNDEAENAYRQITEMRPSSAEPYFALGNFYADTGRDADAKVVFGKAARIEPGNYLYHYMYGVELYRTQQVEEAASRLHRATQLNPRHADSYYWLGKIYLAQHQAAQALKAFERAVNLEPKHIGAFYQLALLYTRLGESEKAHQALEMRAELTRRLHEGIVAERMPPAASGK